MDTIAPRDPGTIRVYCHICQAVDFGVYADGEAFMPIGWTQTDKISVSKIFMPQHLCPFCFRYFLKE